MLADDPAVRFLEWLRHEEEALDVDFARREVRWRPRRGTRSVQVRVAPRTLTALLDELCERGALLQRHRTAPRNPELAAWELLLSELRRTVATNDTGAPMHLDRHGRFTARRSTRPVPLRRGLPAHRERYPHLARITGS